MKSDEPQLTLGEIYPTEEVGYARVSDGDDQDPEMQIALFRERGIPEDNIFVDRQSGRTMERPGLEKALMLMTGRAGWTLVVYKLDRLGRNTAGLLKLMERFEQQGWNLVSLTEQIDTRTPIGKLVFTIMAAFAQMESDLISERTRAGMAHRKKIGAPMGRAPRFTLRKLEAIEKDLLESDLSVKDIAKKHKVSASYITKTWPSWRYKTADERASHRAANPLKHK